MCTVYLPVCINIRLNGDYTLDVPKKLWHNDSQSLMVDSTRFISIMNDLDLVGSMLLISPSIIYNNIDGLCHIMKDKCFLYRVNFL